MRVTFPIYGRIHRPSFDPSAGPLLLWIAARAGSELRKVPSGQTELFMPGKAIGFDPLETVILARGDEIGFSLGHDPAADGVKPKRAKAKEVDHG